MVGLAQHQIPALVPQGGLGLPVQYVSELEIVNLCMTLYIDVFAYTIK